MHSKGRAPDVFVFNPFAEGFMAEGKAFNPTKHQAQLARDLENLPQFLCRQDDIVLVNRPPAIEFLAGTSAAGFAQPEFVEIGCSDNLLDRKLGAFRPWAWGPDSFALLKPLFPNVTGEEHRDWHGFNGRMMRLYSKAWSADFLRRLIRELSPARWLCTEREAGVAADTLKQALDAIQQIRVRGHHKMIVKESLGLAGSNAIRLFEREILEPQRRWMENAFAKKQTLVIEPWLERVVDFSIQLEMNAQGLKPCGFTGLWTDAKGQFLGNWAGSHYHTRIPSEVISVFRDSNNISRTLLDFYADVFALLESELRRAGFVGPIGIDAFVYQDASRAMRLKPVVEINPRYTMGRVMVELMKQASPGSSGELRLINRAMLRKKGFVDFASYAESLRQTVPPQLEGEPVRGISRGAICLGDPVRARVCLPIFRVHQASAHPGGPSEIETR